MFENYTKTMEMCSACPSLCQSACPVFLQEGNRSVSPWGMMQTLNRVRKDDLEFTPDVAKLSYHCTTCRGCMDQCEHDIDITPILLEARNEAVKEGLAPDEIQGFIEKFHRHNNPYSKDLLHKLRGILDDKYFNIESDVVYYASCTTIAKCPEVIKDTFSLFDKLKIDFVGIYADPIQCCGYPLHSAGAEYDFVDVAEVNFHALKNHKLIITGSPACAHTLKTTYDKYDLGLKDKVITINQFLKPYLKNLNYNIKDKIRSKLMFHDPCYLSRHLGEADLPREMIAKMSGFSPIEFFENKQHTSCSGQGGCYSITSTEAEDITKNRLRECYEKKVNTLITQCPSCVYKMRKNSKKIVVKDLISYINDCIQGADE
jgi:Fe-S oxidoreductase